MHMGCTCGVDDMDRDSCTICAGGGGAMMKRIRRGRVVVGGSASGQKTKVGLNAWDPPRARLMLFP